MSVLHETVLLLETLSLLLVLPIAGIGIAFLIAIRSAISVLAKLLRKDLGDLVSGRSSGFALDIYYNNVKPTLPIVVTIHLTGTVSLERLRDEITRVLRSSNGSHRLMQYVTSWMGLFFWRTDTNFQIENHVNLAELKGQVNQIQNELMLKPFRASRSPWELYLIRNGTTESVLILRMHHVLGDGYSILNFLVNGLCQTKSPAPVLVHEHRIYTPKSLIKKFVHHASLLLFPIKAANDLVRTFNAVGAQILYPAKNSQASEDFKTTFSEPIPWEVFREIRQINHVSFTAILASSLGSIIRDLLNENSLEVPEHVSCFTLLPVPGHPAGFHNHMSGYFFKIPLTKLSTRTRLFLTESHIQESKRSSFPTTFFYLTSVIGLPFHWITKFFFGTALATVIASNFVGPSHQIAFGNHHVTKCTFAAGLGPGNACLGISSLSYNGNVQIGITLNQSCLPGTIRSEVLATKIKNEILT